MNQYYEDMLKMGREFEAFICRAWMRKFNVDLGPYSTKSDQMKGENRRGIEIKLDLNFRKTGNLYIEFAEKTDKKNKHFILSGIFRDDNTKTFMIGDYGNVYMFPVILLRNIQLDKKYKIVETPTSRGFLLPIREIEGWPMDECFRWEPSPDPESGNV